MSEFEKKLTTEAKHSSLKTGIFLLIFGIMVCMGGVDSLREGTRVVIGFLATILGPVFAIGGIMCIKNSFGNGYKNDFRKNLRSYGISVSDLEHDMNNAWKVGDLMFGNKYLLETGMTLKVIPYWELVWVYLEKKKTKYKLEGVIPMGSQTTYTVVLREGNGLKKTIDVATEDGGIEVIRKIQNIAPFTLYGWDKQIEDNFQQARVMVRQRYQEYSLAMQQRRVGR